jgi:hypothetical protein
MGPDNKLIFTPGLLTGTTLVNTSRLSIGAKSPLTQGIKESDAGGTVAASLGKLGILIFSHTIALSYILDMAWYYLYACFHQKQYLVKDRVFTVGEYL